MGKIRQMLAERFPANAKRAIKRQLRLVPAAAPSVIEIASYPPFEVAFRKGTADEEVLKDSFTNDIFFPNLPEYKPNSDDVIIDVGAHIGTFSMAATQKAPKGRVFAIEPCLETFNLLRINKSLNRLEQIDISRLALADKKGTCRLFYDAGNWGHSTVAALSHRGEDVPCDTLKNFLDAKNIQRCQLMKMNCEGGEFPILLSTSPQVLKRIDMLLVLYHCDLYGKGSHQLLVEHLQKSGFNVTLRKQLSERGWIIATR